MLVPRDYFHFVDDYTAGDNLYFNYCADIHMGYHKLVCEKNMYHYTITRLKSDTKTLWKYMSWLTKKKETKALKAQ